MHQSQSSITLSVCLSVCLSHDPISSWDTQTNSPGGSQRGQRMSDVRGQIHFFYFVTLYIRMFWKKYFNFLRLCLCGTTPVVKLLQLWCLILRWGRNAACLNSTLLHYYPPCIQMSVWGTSVQIILQSLLLRNCFKVSTIVLLLLILLKKPIFITNCNVCYSDLY